MIKRQKALAPVERSFAPDYYRHNFRFLVGWVQERYSDLFTAEEQQFVERFHQLDDAGQCLVARLIGRKGPYFRQDKLHYPEIAELEQTALKLVQAGLLIEDPPLSAENLAGLLTRGELLTLFPETLQGHSTKRKFEWLELLSGAHLETRHWSAWTGNRYGRLFQCELGAIVQVFRLLFFGNTYQNLTEFVLQDLGLMRYEAYEVDPSHRLFRRREDLEHYLLLAQWRERLESATSADELHEIAQDLAALGSSESVARKRSKFILRLAQALERAGQWRPALKFYQQTSLPPARERRVRLLEKLGDCEQAWQQLAVLLEAPLTEHERQTATRMAPRIAKKAGKKHTRQPRVLLREHSLSLANSESIDVFGVEECVRLQLHSAQAPCFYVENALFNGLLGLWLWPEMFRSVPGAFCHPFQLAPLDLYREGFQQRRPGMDKLWQQLTDGTYHGPLKRTWREKCGIANALVHWETLDETLLDLALSLIPPPHLKAVFSRMLFDLRSNRSGLPDLVQFFPATGQYRLIEVKGPGDRVQDNQRLWLTFFETEQIAAEVCYVNG